jgi:molybdopterin-guanine dinucleotide biosynthesis protein
LKIIPISGKSGSGKDTVAAIMANCLRADGQRVLVTHYADAVKFVCTQFFDWNGEKDEYGRRLLQTVGTDVVRAKDPDFWVRFLSEIFAMFQDRWDVILIPDCRFPNEIGYLRKRGYDVTHLHVVRPNNPNALTGNTAAHISEAALDAICPDAYLINNGTMEELEWLTANWLLSTGIL